MSFRSSVSSEHRTHLHSFRMIGLYYHHAGWLYGQQRKAGDHTAAENIVRAHYSYINATKCIPQDDEKHACTSRSVQHSV